MRRILITVISGLIFTGEVRAQGAAPTVPTPPVAAIVESTIPPPIGPSPVTTVQPMPPPPPAKALFGAVGVPAKLAPRAIGFYSRGCLAGAAPLPIDGPQWQAMRLSRNRNWGHPDLIALVERLAAEAKAHDGWPGLLVGDISQPRGGPMVTGHASHQVGLDADIWLTPMPERRMTETEREELAATSMLGPEGVHVDANIWSAKHGQLILRAAAYPEVERIFVHPGIKKALCLGPWSTDPNLRKVRPMWGHNYHMHIRIACPKGSENCQPQVPVPIDNGCGKEVDDWITLVSRPQKPPPPPDPNAKPVVPKPKPEITLDQLPPDCRAVLAEGDTGLLLAPKPLHASHSAK